MKSLKTPFRWLLQPLFVAPLGQCEANAADLVTFRFLAWRRKVLVLVLVVTGLTAAIDTVFKQLREPRPTLTILIKLGTESEPAQQTQFGDIADQFWLLSFYAMPASALLAAICWARPRASRSILLAGWIASFLVPVAIALTPWSWWTVDTTAPDTRVARVNAQYERIAEGLYWGYYYVIALSPAVLALVPGVMRACIRVKTLLPAAILPGWFLVAAAPFNGLVVLVTFVALAQVAPSPLLLTGMVLWLAAPFVYVAQARIYTRPLVSAAEMRRARQAQGIAWVLSIASAACLITYTATWEAFGWRLVGLDAKTSLVRPWDIIRYGLDFIGRALFVTVLGADLLLQATLSAWRQQREFTATPASHEFDRLMERLEDITGSTGKPRATY
jgi:hypothetical protein